MVQERWLKLLCGEHVWKGACSAATQLDGGQSSAVRLLAGMRLKDVYNCVSTVTLVNWYHQSLERLRKLI